MLRTHGCIHLLNTTILTSIVIILTSTEPILEKKFSASVIRVTTYFHYLYILGLLVSIEAILSKIFVIINFGS